MAYLLLAKANLCSSLKHRSMLLVKLVSKDFSQDELMFRINCTTSLKADSDEEHITFRNKPHFAFSK